VIGDRDHAVSREQLRAFAVRRHEAAFLVLQALRAMHGHAFARDQLGQCIDLALDPPRLLGIDVDQATPGMPVAEGGGSGWQPAL
jgi:hypothetical protein